MKELKLSDDLIIERSQRRIKKAYDLFQEISFNDLNRTDEFQVSWFAVQELKRALDYAQELLARKRRAAKTKKRSHGKKENN